jgi:hypothetical protein
MVRRLRLVLSDEGAVMVKLYQVASIIVMLIASLLISPSHAVSLQALIDGNGTVTQGDKVFSNFASQPIFAVGDVTPLTAGEIDVQGVTVNGEHGLRFSGPFSALFEPGGSLAITTYHFGFDVQVGDPSFLMQGVRHAYQVAHSGAGFQNRNVTATTEVRTCELFFCAGPGEFDHVETSSSLQPIASHPSPTNVDESVLFPNGVDFLKVNQDLFIQAGSLVETDAQSIAFPYVDITFAQAPIPEPSTALLLVPGLMALWWLGRRKAAMPRLS